MKFGLGRVRQVTAFAVVLIQLLSIGVIPRVQEAHAAPAQTRQVAPGRYIVRLKPTTAGFTSAASVAATYDAKPGVKVDQIYNSIFSGFAGNFTDAAARDLARDPNVLDVFPDGISTVQAQYDLPGIKRIGANLNPTKAGDGANSVDVDVAVIDTGVDKHPDLNVYRGKDCTITRQATRTTTTTVMARTLPARSGRRTTATASSASRRARASGRSRSSPTATALPMTPRRSAGWIMSAPMPPRSRSST